jgi:hypothetical protein
MTAISTLFGVLPVALGLGAGAEGRRPLGVAVAGGLVVSTRDAGRDSVAHAARRGVGVAARPGGATGRRSPVPTASV